jgi:hypothetical protein
VVYWDKYNKIGYYNHGQTQELARCIAQATSEEKAQSSPKEEKINVH